MIGGTARITDRERFLSKVIEDARTRLNYSGFFEPFTAVKKRMAAGMPELVKFIPTVDSARVPEGKPTTGRGSVDWTAKEITTLETNEAWQKQWLHFGGMFFYLRNIVRSQSR